MATSRAVSGVRDAERTGRADGQAGLAADREGGERVGVTEVDVGQDRQAGQAILAADDLLEQVTRDAARCRRRSWRRPRS